MKNIAEKIERAAHDLRIACARKKIFILLSGGVDSTLCALLALRAGCDVAAVTMRNSDDTSSLNAAEAVCRALGIEGWTFDLRAEFERLVAAPFRDAYRRGETPNPCAVCNPAIKFGLLWERIAERHGCDDFLVATGHYAKTIHTPTGVELHRGADRSKDQSYFLCMMPQARIDRLVLPLGDFRKSESRDALRLLAGDNALLRSIAEKEESMEICFLKNDYRTALGDQGRPGPIVDAGGRVLGTHSGIENFTVGQRKGLGIAAREPLFVTEILPATDTVVVSRREDAMQHAVTAHRVNILAPNAYADGARLLGKIRSQAAPAPCTIRTEADRVTATFDTPLFAPAPGQYLALYDNERLVAGGEIVRT